MNKRELSFLIMVIIIVGLIAFIVWGFVEKKHNEADPVVNSKVKGILSEQLNVYNMTNKSNENMINNTSANTKTNNSMANTVSTNTTNNSLNNKTNTTENVKSNTINKNSGAVNNNTSNIQNNIEKTPLPKLNLKIKNKILTATLYENEATRELIKKFPITITMSDLNNNEKYSYLSQKFTKNEEDVTEIKTGDIMLYGDNCLVIFYKDLPTIYNYTKIGHIDNTAELLSVVGDSNVDVAFSIVESKNN